MANALRKGLQYFGLADDGQAELDSYDQFEPDYAVPAAAAYAPVELAEVTPIRANQAYQPVANHSGAAGDLRRITTIHPRSYNDARLIGEAFRNGTPVIMNLTDMSDDDAKRLVDFSSGLIFGLHGGLERVTAKVFLLSPEHIDVVGEEEVGGGPISGQFYNQS